MPLNLHRYGAVKAMQQYHEKSGNRSLRHMIHRSCNNLVFSSLQEFRIGRFRAVVRPALLRLRDSYHEMRNNIMSTTWVNWFVYEMMSGC